MADRWLIQFGEDREKLRTIGKASTRAQAAAVAQAHFDASTQASEGQRMVFDAENPAGEYRSVGGWYKITRLASGSYPVFRG